ncbi:MAG: DUF541 domain-containing protein [Alphaproteobacteria bacterium]|nr:DUF541 domain-containing protein [Alphaproteobacteria bacterium]
MAAFQKIKQILLVAALLASPSAYAQMPPPPPPPHIISVSGEAHEQVAADRVIFNITLASKNAKLSAAKTANDALVEQLVKVTKEFSIPKDKINTSNIYISPEYRYEQNTGEQKFVGYNISRIIRVTLDDLSQHEKFLAALIEAKIDLWDANFTLIDMKAHSEKLRLAAFADAKAKAESLAKAAGNKLGGAVSIVAGGNPAVGRPPMPMLAMRADAASLAVPPALPGMVSLAESVEVTFALE